MFQRKDAAALFDLIDERDLLPLYRGGVGTDEAIANQQHFPVAIDEARMCSLFDEARANSAADIEGVWNSWFGALQGVFGTQDAPRPVVIKAPDYGLSAKFAFEHLPASRVILIVRHPVFSISSMRKMRERQTRHWNLTTLRVLAEATRIELLHRAIAELRDADARRLRVVRFEDLVTDTEAVMQDVATFLGIEFDDCLLVPTMNGEPWHGDSSFERMRGGGVRRMRLTRPAFA